MARSDKSKGSPLPSRDELLQFINENGGEVSKREIARAFRLKGDQRIWLMGELSALADSGKFQKKGRRNAEKSKRLPSVLVLEVTKITGNGEAKLKPVDKEYDSLTVSIVLSLSSKNKALVVGSRILAKIASRGRDKFTATVMKTLENTMTGRVYGIVEGNHVKPVERKQKQSFVIAPNKSLTAKEADLVIAEILPSNKALGLTAVEIVEVIGSSLDIRSISMLEALSKEIPTDFPPAVTESAEEAKPVSLGKRVDLRERELVTIDGSDAKDFDDAVWAEADDDPANAGGFKLTVAIADVSWYVHESSLLDREALKRGNSSYFPDRVFPMLPEALSNGLCSLVPDEDRACLACDLTISNDGTLIMKRFYRGLMRSAARLTYEVVQQTADANGEAGVGHLWLPRLKPIYGAFHLLKKKREERGALGIESQEFQVSLNENRTHIEDIKPRQRLTSHELIEEFMILANVAAAETLEAKNALCMYRIHEPPDNAKVENLRSMLRGLDITLPQSKLSPAHFNRVLSDVEKSPYKELVHESVLRSQSAAFYGPKNLGHFGLSLNSYGHFTSPIRRYADLVVHRQLVHHLGLGEGGFNYENVNELVELGETISLTERRSVSAERSSKDRYAAAFYAKRIGEVVEGRVSSTTKFGLFIKLASTGADGLLPFSGLPDDRYYLSENEQSVEGKRWGRIFSRGDTVRVKITEANPIISSLSFELVDVIESVMPESAGTKPKTNGKRLPKKRYKKR